MKVYEAKVQAIRNMPGPTDVEGVRRLCSIVQYMSRFLLDHAGTLKPIHAPGCKETPFVWSKECDRVFNTFKSNLSESSCLAYFDASREVVTQVLTIVNMGLAPCCYKKVVS